MKTGKTKKPLSLLLSLVMVLTMIPAITLSLFAPAKAYGTYQKTYSTEYYYPSGTHFVKNFGMCYYESESTTWSQIRGLFGVDDDNHAHIFPDSYHTYWDDRQFGHFVYQDLTAGMGGDYYVAMGDNTTTDPAAAQTEAQRAPASGLAALTVPLVGMTEIVGR